MEYIGKGVCREFVLFPMSSLVENKKDLYSILRNPRCIQPGELQTLLSLALCEKGTRRKVKSKGSL